MARRRRRCRRARPRGVSVPQAQRHGRVLWERLVETATEAELSSALIERYGIDEERAEADVATFLADMRQRKLLESTSRSLCPSGIAPRRPAPAPQLRGCRRASCSPRCTPPSCSPSSRCSIRWVPLPRVRRLLGVRLDLVSAHGRREQLRLSELPAVGPGASCAALNRVADVLAVQQGSVPASLARRRASAAPPRSGGAPRRAPAHGDTLRAHAWLEIDGHPLEDIAAFTSVPAHPAGRRR